MVAEPGQGAAAEPIRTGSTRTVTERAWVAHVAGATRGLCGALAVVAVAGSAGLAWAGVSESQNWLLALLLTGPFALFFGLLAFRGRISIPLGRTVTVAHDPGESGT